MVFISPDHKGPWLFLGGGTAGIRSYHPTAGDQGDDSGTKSSKHQLVRERLLGEDDGGLTCPNLVKKNV